MALIAFLKFGLWGLGVSVVLAGKQFHEQLTEDDYRSIFMTQDSPPTYTLASVKSLNSGRSKREAPNDRKQPVALEAFGKKYELYLESTNNVLYGSETPVYLASGSADQINYQRIKFPNWNNVQLHQDRLKRAAIAIHEDEEGRKHFNGLVGDDLAIRSIPSRVRRSLGNESLSDDHHVIIKIPQAKGTHMKNRGNFVSQLSLGGQIEVDSQNFGDIFGKGAENLENLGLPDGSHIMKLDPNNFVDNLGGFMGNVFDDLKPQKPENIGPNTQQPNRNVDLLNNLINIINLRSKRLRKPTRQVEDPVESDDETFLELEDFIDSTDSEISTSDSEIEYEYSGDVAYPQILVIVDWKTASHLNHNLENIVSYIIAFWNAVDLRFRELENPEVRVNIGGIIIPKNSEAVRYIADPDISRSLLDRMGRQMRKASRVIPYNSYDVIAAILNRPHRSGTTGLAMLRSACSQEDGDANLAFFDQGGFSGVMTATHELGHVLGADHDNSCNVNEVGHIMADSATSTRPTSIRWSRCSRNSIRNFLESYQASCLFNEPKVGTYLKKPLPGQFLNRNQQCASVFGPGYRQDPDKASNCITLYCKYGGSKRWAFTPPAEGSSCGNNKICLSGKCTKADI